MTTDVSAARVDRPPVLSDPRPAREAGRRLSAACEALARLARHVSFVEDEILGLGDWVAPGDVCIDIGAEYGLYTLALAARVGPRGRVHSIEPQQGAARILDAGVQLVGGGDTVVTHRVALADEPGWDILSVPRRNGLPVHGRAYLRNDTHGPGPNVEFSSSKPVPVEVTTLDAFCATQGIARLDFVKADVEGAELKVLHGGLQTLRRHRPVVQLEIEHPHVAKYGVNTVDVLELLSGMGYSMRCWADGMWRPADRITPDSRNYVFTPGKR